MQVKCVVKESTIPKAGLGLFADENILKGTIVWKWSELDHDIYRNEHELYQKLKTLKSNNEIRNYLDKIFGDYIKGELLLLYPKSDNKHINHSHNNYNLIGYDFDDFHMYAYKDIQKGEELFESYNDYIFPQWFIPIAQKYNIWLADNPKIVSKL